MNTGIIKLWHSTTAPTGWLPCDGAAIPEEHTDLIAVVGPNTPRLNAGDFVKASATPLTTNTNNAKVPGSVRYSATVSVQSQSVSVALSGSASAGNHTHQNTYSSQNQNIPSNTVQHQGGSTYTHRNASSGVNPVSTGSWKLDSHRHGAGDGWGSRTTSSGGDHTHTISYSTSGNHAHDVSVSGSVDVSAAGYSTRPTSYPVLFIIKT